MFLKCLMFVGISKTLYLIFIDKPEEIGDTVVVSQLYNARVFSQTSLFTKEHHVSNNNHHSCLSLIDMIDFLLVVSQFFRSSDVLNFFFFL